MRFDLEGIGRKKIFITKGHVGARINKKGLRLKKTVRGNTISQLTSQINLNVIKQGSKALEEIFGKTAKEVKEEKKEEKPKEGKDKKEIASKSREEVNKAEAKE